jgi:hypothetical protein
VSKFYPEDREATEGFSAESESMEVWLDTTRGWVKGQQVEAKMDSSLGNSGERIMESP